jgi:hypothetical protein
MTITRTIVLLAAAQVLTGCGSSRPLVGPSSVPPAPSPLGVVQVTGYVSDTAFRALAGVRVAVLDGPQADGCTSVLGDRREHCELKNHRITLTRR